MSKRSGPTMSRQERIASGTPRVEFTISLTLLEQLDQLVRDLGGSRSARVREALEMYFAYHRSLRKKAARSPQR